MLSTLLLSLAVAGPAPSPLGNTSDMIAVQAGTIYVVEDNRVIRGGGMIVIRDGKVVMVGKAIDPPSGVRVVDYGPDAVIIPGLVAAASGLGSSWASERTAEPGLSAVDNFDSYGDYSSMLAGGVTTAYIAPAQGRLIAGQGAVVKLGGEAGEGRVLSGSASIHGSISADARATRGYWKPPVPATVDVGMGVARPQLPRTTMGAMVALQELLSLSADPKDSIEYGAFAGDDLRGLLKAGTRWRMRAESEGELRALIEFFGENNLPLVIDGASAGAGMVRELSAAGVPVVVYSSARTNSSPRDLGKEEGAQWSDNTLASSLSAAGVPVILAQSRGASVRDLLFHASFARAGGLSMEDALAGVTSYAARVLGVDDRVGTLGSGKDADLVVLNGAPFGAGSSVMATWINGEIAYKAKEAGPVVLEVEELYLGNGEVLSPGQVLMENGRIVEVGRQVSHPNTCTVVRGVAAMPGMIDALGHLGLEGSTKGAPTRYKLSQLVEPGDFADRRVAQAGVTTVVMTPRGSGTGVPAMAYKPAGNQVEDMVIMDPAAIHVSWLSSNRTDAGRAVKALLAKGVDYKRRWDEYNTAMASWTPPEPEAKESTDEDDAKDKDEDKDDKEDADDDKKKKKKKKKKGEDPPKPVTGVWIAQIEQEGTDSLRLRIQLSQDASGGLEARLRCDGVSSSLVLMTGERDGHGVELHGSGSNGDVTISAKTEELKLVGTLKSSGVELSFSAEQKAKEVVTASRSQVFVEQEKAERPAKGTPKAPRLEADLEVVRAALEGRGTFVVRVDREDEILKCVEAFEAHGVKPVLRGAGEAWKVADQLVGRIRGVLLTHAIMVRDADKGVSIRNRYAQLMNAGLEVAFHSAAEEGASQIPVMATYAVSQGMSPTGALRALTSGAANMMSIGDRVGTLRAGLDADVLLLDGNPLDAATSVQRVWVNGREVRLHE